MRRPRLVIPVTIQFAVRYLVRTGLLGRLAERATPVVLTAWDDAELLRDLVEAGAEVHLLPDARYGDDYRRVRRQVDLWQNLRLRSPSFPVDARRVEAGAARSKRRIRALRRWRDRLVVSAPGAADRLARREQAELARDTNLAEFDALLASLRADAVLSLTPFHQQEQLLLRAAALRGVPQCAAVLSFDNLTTRGWIPPVFQQYLVWNAYNEQELRRGYPEAREARVSIVGPAQFDFYWDDRFLLPLDEWRAATGVPAGRPLVLYGAGPKEIVPHEPLFLDHLDQAVTAGELPRDALILFRRHPMDCLERWQPVLGRARNVVIQEPWALGTIAKYTNIRDDDIRLLVGTLRHTDVHVNVSSTMTIDGAVFDRPQVGPAYDDRPGRPCDRITRELYEREHFLPIVASGGLAVARNRADMIRAVREGLADPGARRAERNRMVREICTFTDGRSTGRVVDEVVDFLDRHTGSAS